MLKLTTSELGRSQGELRALASNLLTSQETERRRIARELHDDVSQRLAQIEMDSDDVLNVLETNPQKAASTLQEIRAGLGKLSEDIRQISHRLHPAILEDLGLAPALRALVEDVDRKENLIVTFSERNIPEPIPLTSPLLCTESRRNRCATL